MKVPRYWIRHDGNYYKNCANLKKIFKNLILLKIIIVSYSRYFLNQENYFFLQNFFLKFI